MKKYFNAEAISVGLAMFSMFFGAGNLIFPLALGQVAGDKNFYALIGLLITAVLMPIAGVIAMIMYEGNYRDFFGRLGKWPGFVLSLVLISLLGPLGSSPRCIALAYSSLKGYIGVTPWAFGGLSCAFIFLCTMNKKRILPLLGVLLTPLLLISLGLVMVAGFLQMGPLPPVEATRQELFLHGLKEGYNTQDLMAAFFFSSAILSMLRLRLVEGDSGNKQYLQTALHASVISGLMLILIYLGFGFLAGLHASSLLVDKDQLLSAITHRVAGSYAEILVSVTVILACLTTAIALISAFADFLHREVVKERCSYPWLLIPSLLVTCYVSTLEFNGISAFLGPLLTICYPSIIVLTLLNILHRWIGFSPIKLPVFLTLALSISIHWLG